MKRLAIYTLMLVLVAGMAYAKDYEMKKKAGEFDVAVKIDKNPPIVGDNNVLINGSKPLTMSVVGRGGEGPTPTANKRGW
ncbi:MAG: hypothetical protein ACYC69_17590 [Thermodesulfovibrionales bacterium]